MCRVQGAGDVGNVFVLPGDRHTSPISPYCPAAESETFQVWFPLWLGSPWGFGQLYGTLTIKKGAKLAY